MRQKIFFVIILFFSISYLNSQVFNQGVLKIQEATDVYFGEEYTNNLGATHYCNGDLYLESNFINNGTTKSTAGTVSFISSTNKIQTISGSSNQVNFYNLKTDMSTTGTLGVSVVDNFGLYIENSVNLDDGDLRLVGDAQLIQTHTGSNANTSISGLLHKDQQGYASAYGYNHWSSPVNNGGSYSLNGVLFDGTDSDINPFSSQQVLFNSGSLEGSEALTDGSGNVITPLSISSRWLYKFSRGSTGEYADWIKIDENSNLLPGEGYLMKGTNTANSSQNYVFKGEPNDGTYSFTVGAGESNLFGNPYPSAIDASKFISNNLSLFDGTLYFWVEGGSTNHYRSDYLGGYATRNLTTGVSASVNPSEAGLGSANTTSPTQYIAVGQGFFMDTTANGSIVFDNSLRVFKTEGSGESIHYKSTESKVTEENSVVRIGYEDPENFHRQIALGFLPNSPDANLNYNVGYDALMSGEREDELFFIIDNDLEKKYVIQGVGAFNESLEFDLGLIMSEEGAHKIMLDGVENFSQDVFLKDVFSGTIYNLNQAEYNIELPTGSYLDRFKLVFVENVLLVDNIQELFLNVYYNSTSSNIILLNSRQIKLNAVEVYNNIGQIVYKQSKQLNSSSKIKIPFNLSNGLYYVKVMSENKKEIYKILKI
ncbi:T9SS type A sorting domain-containing protein [Lutibacter sp. TH_r2]|uniref:T9SS type A sorting domain-containing protein n=1 Tax=Lutibacter sp. TH_r2 TaxID=3082083 RepID=UPI00295373BD|nr:T9SS type A sorting domain-containing protein [Lutibacter sp. TH_r2]MDV7186155.1 T9SS type A sorting domain-containing protein [Lutibacter sp. TH_r2]